MALLSIVKYPNPILKQPALKVKEINKEIRRLIDDMSKTMYNAPGLGLAAPQIGQSLRLAVIDPTGTKSQQLIALINPEIIRTEGETLSEEGCLSLPGLMCEIKRFTKVWVKGYDLIKEKMVEIEARDLLARILQHEIDHLNGTLILDRLGPVKRELYKKRYLKRLKKLKNNETL
jgi:peptide deformylase